MATIEQFRQLGAALSTKDLSELGSKFIADPEATSTKIIQMAAEKGFSLTEEEIIQFIAQMDENDEFSDIELSPEALAAVAGGRTTFGDVFRKWGAAMSR